MCGIAGWLSYSQNMDAQRDTLQRMTDTMALRGPDAGGLWIDGPVDTVKLLASHWDEVANR